MQASELSAEHNGKDSADKGSALVVVLWVSALLAALAAGFSISMRTESQLAINLVESTRARALADAAIQRGIGKLMNATAEAPAALDATPVPFSFGGGELAYAIQSERGKVDLNVAPGEFLKGVLREAGMGETEADALGDAIADWRDEDDSRHLHGAEAPEYRAAGRKFEPTNAAFRTIVELQQVIGIDQRLYRRIAPFFTIHSFVKTINPAYASRQVLAAIPGVNKAEVETLVAAREEKNYNKDNAEGGALPILSGVSEWVTDGPGSVYTVTGSAKLPSGAQFSRDVVVWIPNVGEGRYWILDTRTGSVIDTEASATK